MYINGRVIILTKKVTIILHIIDVNLAIPKTMTVAYSSLIVLLSTNTFILHYPTLSSKKFDIAVARSFLIVLSFSSPFHLPFSLSTTILFDISNAEYQTRILPHSSLIVLSFSNPIYFHSPSPPPYLLILL